MKLSAKLSAAVAVLAISFGGSAQDLDPALKAGEKINKSAQGSQKKVDKIADTIQSKIQQFKAVNKEIDGLNVYNGQLKKQIDNQLQEMADLNASIDQVSVIERQITPLMIRMIDGLDQFVQLDVPFLPVERASRVAGLREMMDRADIAVSEKFRRVLESYQVEMEYGRSIEAYDGIIELGNKEREVDFLRIGRLLLIYQTKDGSTSGMWDKESKSWQPLSDEHKIQITKGLRMAKKQLAPDMLILPVKS